MKKNKMRQAIMTEPGKIEFKDDAEVPKIKDNEILLKIQRIGVCGSDIHVFHGKHPFTKYPVVQGHEYSGIVEKIGKDVTKVKPGDKATARPQLVCGECAPCKRGDYNICDLLRVEGFQAPGCAQDFFAVPKERIIPLPDSFTPEQGALVEPAAVGAHSTGKAGDLTGKNVVVLGAGMIGNMVAQLARCRRAKKVLITDVIDFKLDIAKKCNIAEVSNVRNESLAEASKRVFGEEGFNIAFEAAGNEKAMSAGIESIEKGGKIVVLGVFDDKPKIDMSIVGDRELQLIGTLMYKHEDYEKAVDLIASGDIITEVLVTKHYPFEQYLDAYKFVTADKKTMKVMIDVND